MHVIIYTQLVKFKEEDTFICKVGKTPEEIQQLIEDGFEYVCAQENVKFFGSESEAVLGLCQESIMVPSAGFEPAASTMPTSLKANSNLVENFRDFLRVNRRLEETTIKATLQDV